MPIQEEPFVETLVASIMAVDESAAAAAGETIARTSSLSISVHALAAAARDRRIRRAIVLAAERIVARERGQGDPLP